MNSTRKREHAHESSRAAIRAIASIDGADREFSRLFKVLFGAAMKYLDSKGWGESGSWVQVIDEPTWTDPATLANTQ